MQILLRKARFDWSSSEVTDAELPFNDEQRKPLKSYLQHYHNRTQEFVANCGRSNNEFTKQAVQFAIFTQDSTPQFAE
ncbi:hypothetical protein P879_04331 [Paragonimus westermani]|uniref:Uncharacterized protein n=1 Tax=Paragonimus westermani TaxID=34504 RepID=A0A8T0D2G4_9TREM|nr:hypothetical protein P879_04331 [Paragonimus westermani]